MIQLLDHDKEIVALWYELAKSQAILQRMLNRGGEGLIDKSDLRECECEALAIVQRRFPSLGVHWK